MPANKTVPTSKSVAAFIRSVPDETRRRDCQALVKLMKSLSGADPKMWGSTIVGFGDYHYTTASGREADWFRIGFSPRKKDLTLYVIAGTERYQDLLRKIGKHSTGRACLYVKRLADIDLGVLERVIKASLKDLEALRQSGGTASGHS